MRSLATAPGLILKPTVLAISAAVAMAARMLHQHRTASRQPARVYASSRNGRVHARSWIS